MVRNREPPDKLQIAKTHNSLYEFGPVDNFREFKLDKEQFQELHVSKLARRLPKLCVSVATSENVERGLLGWHLPKMCIDKMYVCSTEPLKAQETNMLPLCGP